MTPINLGRAVQWLTALVFCTACICGSAAENPRELIRLDQGWRFALGHATEPTKDFNHGTGYFSYLAKTGYGDGAAHPAFDDRGWREITIPHDWAVEVPFDPKGSHSHGYKAVGPRFPENSVGWYRRRLDISQSDFGRRIQLRFDGVYRNARVFVNGFFVGEEPSGYLPAVYDITDYLNYGGENVVAVRADASFEEGWFYEGAGIYRHAWLEKLSPVHIATDGIWVRTEVSGKQAAVSVEATVVNAGTSPSAYSLHFRVIDTSGNVAAEGTTDGGTVAPGGISVLNAVLQVTNPKLWTLENPELYVLETSVISGQNRVDQLNTTFGVRTIRFDPDRGFFLNDKHVVLKGTNNHQDHAGVGAAIPDALQVFRLARLKEMGSNAYRASHNPPTKELLDACDRMGILVIDETRLMGSNAYHLTQLERLMKRDRNHPSIILWSLGNEEWAIEGNIFGARITTTMQNFAKRIDPTRLSTVAISGGWGGTSTVVDVAGFNYIKQGDTDKQHAEFPKQIIIGTEETTTQQTRGIYFDDRAKCHLSPQEDGSSGFNAEIGWRHYAARPYAAGVFYWTGFDYRGEPTPFGYPAIASQFGILDTCGFPKDGFYYLKAWWTDEPVLHIFPHWNWPERVGQPIEVRAHSNCDEVELFLNGVSLGRKAMPRNERLAWNVVYQPGALEARGYRAGKEILKRTLHTTGQGTQIALVPDRSAIVADDRDVSVVTVEIRDREGRVVPTANIGMQFAVEGPGKIVGVGNGDPSSLEPDVFVGSSTVIPIGAWKAPDAAPSKDPVVFEATFDAPNEDAGERALLLNALGPKQTAVLNGEELYRDAAPDKSRTAIDLKGVKLRATGNLIRITSNRFERWGDREALQNFLPASLRVVKPSEPWRRSSFNGLAQVIVQHSGEAGAITLKASAQGLAAASVRIEAK